MPQKTIFLLQSVSIHLFNCLSLSLSLSLFPPPLAFPSVDSRCDLNVINGFSGSAWIRFACMRFIPALSSGLGAHVACFLDECPLPCQQSFARSLLINSSAEGRPKKKRRRKSSLLNPYCIRSVRSRPLPRSSEHPQTKYARIQIIIYNYTIRNTTIKSSDAWDSRHVASGLRDWAWMMGF